MEKENNVQKSNGNINIENNNDTKRNIFQNKNDYSMQSPLYSYFNDSHKYLSSQYSQNQLKRTGNQINKMEIIH